jgi:hypothetical protein
MEKTKIKNALKNYREENLLLMGKIIYNTNSCEYEKKKARKVYARNVKNMKRLIEIAG